MLPLVDAAGKDSRSDTPSASIACRDSIWLNGGKGEFPSRWRCGRDAAKVKKLCLDKPLSQLLAFGIEGKERHPVMKLALQTSGGSRNCSVFRILFILLITLAFSAQAYLSQTHIHGVTQEELTIFLTGIEHNEIDAPQPGKKKPALPDEDNCPLCRLAATTCSLVVPIIDLILPVQFVIMPALAVTPIVAESQSVSHHWQVRAPPPRDQ